MKFLKQFLLALALLGIARLGAQTTAADTAPDLAKSVSIQYVAGKSRSDMGAVRLCSTGEPFTVGSPLTVQVIPLDSKGAPLKPPQNGGLINWTSEKPVDNDVRGRNVMIEVPIGTYRGAGEVGTLASVLRRFDPKAIHSVKISFQIKIRDTPVDVAATISGDEARRFFGPFFSQ
ncbi:MAG TPA: hypothetical protein VHY22_05695 [Chthoniobacteraceae bacterium]|jgi:hypothetical protein|nr:hypothetical protein [Chthoniobacteraceae bacterium]